MIPWSYQVMLIIMVAIAAGFDVKYRRIPNWLVVTGLVWGIAMNVFLFGWPGLKTSLIGIGIAFVIYFPLFMLRGMGAGDVKLMMAIGALVGPANWFLIFMITGILGGVIALLLLAWRKRLRHTLSNVFLIVGELLSFRAPYMADKDLDVHSPKAITMPHGATIAAGSILFLIGVAFMGGR
jgi:prepilin peptidase CpaA